MKCRACNAELEQGFLDLGFAPPSNAYLSPAALSQPACFYPLRVLVCAHCWLVQSEDYARAEDLFRPDYAYFSSFSTSWLEHARQYIDAMADRFGLGADSHIVEVAANDGYLLQYAKGRGIPCLGIEPTASTASAARAKGVEIIEDFFGVHLAQQLAVQGRAADLMVANNVLAHVPDINDFVRGFTLLLKPGGVATFEFPHLLHLMAENQFDTVYHEHFSYLSLTAVRGIFERNGLDIFDVTELSTHGGSLRVYAQGAGDRHASSARVADVLEQEERQGITNPACYAGFQAKADAVKNDFLAFLVAARQAGKMVVGYGAAAKGNTLLNYAGIRRDLLSCVADRNPAKQGCFLPGSAIPIVTEEDLQRRRPDYVVVLPWNLWDEVTHQLAYIREWGGRFVRAIPEIQIE